MWECCGNAIFDRCPEDGIKRGARICGRQTREEIVELQDRCVKENTLDLSVLKQLCKAGTEQQGK